MLASQLIAMAMIIWETDSVSIHLTYKGWKRRDSEVQIENWKNVYSSILQVGIEHLL